MSREIIHTDRAPAAIGTYNQAVKVGNTTYLSGSDPLGSRNNGNGIGRFCRASAPSIQKPFSSLRSRGWYAQ